MPPTTTGLPDPVSSGPADVHLTAPLVRVKACTFPSLPLATTTLLPTAGVGPACNGLESGWDQAVVPSDRNATSVLL